MDKQKHNNNGNEQTINKNIKAVILDLDGVIYRGKQPIKDSDKAVKILNENGIETFFLTNAATRSRKERMEYLKTFNIFTDIDHVYTSGYATAKYIHEHIKNPLVFYVCEKGLGEELVNFGIPIIEHFYANVVIIGLDKQMTYAKLAKATDAIFRGATFIATNDDPAYPYENTKRPGAGALVEFVKQATKKNPIVVGKPNMYLLEYIMKEHNLKKDEMLIIGDNLYTDILMANKSGINSALVLSGLHNKKDIKENVKPTYIFKDLYDLATHLTPHLHPHH